MSKIMSTRGLRSRCDQRHLAQACSTNNLDGRWAATLTEGSKVIPFRLDISGSGNHLIGKLYNGAHDDETTTSAKFENLALILNFEHYLTSIQATL